MPRPNVTKPKRFKLLGGIVGAAVLLAPLSVSAKSKGEIFIETMGVSTAVGLILGASTLPFYQSPGSNLINLAIGAGAGAVVGLGLFGYEALIAKSTDQANSRMAPAHTAGFASNSRNHLTRGETIVWAPVVSLRW